MLIDFKVITRKYGTPKGILHVGANTGQEAEEYNKAGVKHVAWIEALPHIYDKLVKHVSKYSNADYSAMCFNECVSDTDGQTVTFHESNNESQSSSFLELGTHKTAHPEVHYVKDYEMKTIRLDTLLDSYPGIHYLKELDMLVMDIQGAEMLALKGLGDKINQFKYVYLEVNTNEVYKGCALLHEIEKYLKAFGFEIKEQKIFNQWHWGDIFAVRK